VPYVPPQPKPHENPRATDGPARGRIGFSRMRNDPFPQRINTCPIRIPLHKPFDLLPASNPPNLAHAFQLAPTPMAFGSPSGRWCLENLRNPF